MDDVQARVTFGGVDWATDDRAACVVDDAGEICDEFVIEYTEAGLRQLVRRLVDNRVGRVAIERPDGPRPSMLCWPLRSRSSWWSRGR